MWKWKNKKKPLIDKKTCWAYDTECYLLILRAERLIGEWKLEKEGVVRYNFRKLRPMIKFTMVRNQQLIN